MTKRLSLPLVALLFATIARCSPLSSDLSERNDDINAVAISATASSSSSSTASSTSAAASASPTVPYASDDPNYILWTPENDTITPEPVRGSLGVDILGPQNIPVELQNADSLAPPTTDNGVVPNAKWSFSLSPQRLQTGGWAREQNSAFFSCFFQDDWNIDVVHAVYSMPIATRESGISLETSGSINRELHWHTNSEWGYVISGYAQVTSVNQNGQNYVGNAVCICTYVGFRSLFTFNIKGPGDLWYFPSGIPHSIQATNQSADGTEFLLFYFSTQCFVDSMSCSDWMAHIPKEVIAKNFQTSISAFNNIPDRELYIFPALPPTTSEAPSDPAGQVPNPFTYPLSQVPGIPLSGGSVKIVDSTTFTASTTIAAAEVIVEPGAMRQRAALAPNPRRMGFLLGGNWPDDHIRGGEQCHHMGFPGRRCRLHSRDLWPLRREHRKYNPEVPRDIPDRYLPGCELSTVARSDTAGSRKGTPWSVRRDDCDAQQNEAGCRRTDN
ncbi:RmlC-like cupin domain-containing protein [Chiua virens]|nr:RmlC-like cupin domain-containing protein [Chiua virens]